jgi:hypothetical protein
MTLCEAYMGIEPHFNLWNYIFCAGYNSAQTLKWWCWVPWTSFPDLGLELIPTFAFRCSTLRSSGGK